jgi:hypothetical protein
MHSLQVENTTWINKNREISGISSHVPLKRNSEKPAGIE